MIQVKEGHGFMIHGNDMKPIYFGIGQVSVEPSGIVYAMDGANAVIVVNRDAWRAISFPQLREDLSEGLVKP